MLAANSIHSESSTQVSTQSSNTSLLLSQHPPLRHLLHSLLHFLSPHSLLLLFILFVLLTVLPHSAPLFFSPVFVLLLLPPLQIFWILQTTVIDFVWSLRLTTLLLTMSTKTSRLSFLPHPFRSFTPCYIGPKVVHYQPWLSSLANLQLTSFTPPLIYVAELFPSPRLTALSNDKNRSDCENDQLLGLLNYDAASAQHSTESVYMFKENINR